MKSNITVVDSIMGDMTPKLIGETWRKYPTETSTQKSTYGLYKCQYCGKEFETNIQSVKNGYTISCGCRTGGVTHGLRSHRFYKTWAGMIHRCGNIKNKKYKDYGARGISVCIEWLDVATFITWADATHPNKKGYTLDRIDNDKGYSPENCRWADASTQNTNQRMSKKNTSGFVGVFWNPLNKNWRAAIRFKNKKIDLGSYQIKEEAVLARDKYIVENNLPHKLSSSYAY